MPGAMSSTGEELAEPLTEKVASRFSCLVFLCVFVCMWLVAFWFVFGLFGLSCLVFFAFPLFWVPVDLGVKVCMSTIAPQCQEPALDKEDSR